MILVTCTHRDCRRWAVAYTTLEENPRPWGPPIPEGALGVVVNVPLWYACVRHATPKHKPLALDSDQAPVCEFCGRTDGVEWVSSPTMYSHKISVWDWIIYGPVGPPDPNRATPYCPDCAEQDREFWEEMWKDYRSSQGI